MSGNKGLGGVPGASPSSQMASEGGAYTGKHTAAKADGQFRGVIFTYVDHEAEQFISLGGAGWDTEEEARREFDALPEAEAGDFLADYWAGDCHADDKHVSVETIEAKMDEPIAALLARGRVEAAAHQAAIVNRRSRAAMANATAASSTQPIEEEKL